MKPTTKLLGIILIAGLLPVAGCGNSGGGSVGGDVGGVGLTPVDPMVPGESGLPLTKAPDETGAIVNVAFTGAVAVNDLNQVGGFVELFTGTTLVGARWALTSSGEIIPQRLSPIAGNSFSAAFSLDESGMAVGQSADGPRLVAVLWPSDSTSPTRLPELNEPPSGSSKALGISSDGNLIVGEAQDGNGRTHGVIWQATVEGNFTATPTVLPVTIFASGSDLSRYSSASSVAHGAASEILVVGEAQAGNGTIHAALWRSTDNGATFTAANLGANHIAHMIASNRQVVGESTTASYPVLWSVNDQGAAGTPTPITVPGIQGGATDINADGRITGWSGLIPKAAVWNGIFATPLDDSSNPSVAYGLNNAPQPLVVGRVANIGFIKRIN